VPIATGPLVGQGVVVGMFDTYFPMPPITCPWCGAEFRVWQGKDGPNCLLRWTQRDPHPANDPAVATESQQSPERLQAMTLPDHFNITGWCHNDHVTMAHCDVVDGVWVSTELDADDLRRANEQHERDRIVRLREQLKPQQ
jgi:hypothetical protein